MSELSELLQKIAHCPHVKTCIQDKPREHPCRKIVYSQEVSNLDEYQLPEPWNGRIESAPILFLSSNPSINEDEEFPTWTWSEDDINDFFNNRFGGRKEWIKDGTKTLEKNGSHSGSVKFLAAVQQRAIELLDRDVKPGIDYAITEIVHCKSRNEFGVKEAQNTCVDTYLEEVLKIASARVVVVLGEKAKQAIQDKFRIPQNGSLVESMTIGGKERLITFLPHPNARVKRTFKNVLKPDDLQKLREFLNKAKTP